MRRPRSRVAANSEKSAIAVERFPSAVPAVRSIATFRFGFESAAFDLSMNDWEAACIRLALFSESRAATHAGYDFGSMQNANFRAVARQLARHVHQAAEVATEQHVGAGGRDSLRLLADYCIRDRWVFDAERSAKAAAHVVARQRL